MRTRTALLTATAAALLTSFALPAHAAPVAENINRSLFDATPQLTTSTFTVDGPTSGPLGGALDVSVTAPDGTLPTSPGSCEQVDVAAVLTYSPGELLAVTTTGEACAHTVDGSLTVNAFFGRHDLTYTGTAHRSARLVGDGLIAAKHSWLGGQASFGATVRW